MASADQKRNEEHGGLSVARSEFASSLARRLESIESAISALEDQGQSEARRDNLIRRLHALGASAKILGFAAAAESLSRAEQQLRTGLADTLVDDLSLVKNHIANLPSLVLRGTYSMLPTPPSAPPGAHSSPLPSAQGPWCVLVCGGVLLADTLRSAGSASSGFELVHTSDVLRLRELCVTYGPDVVVLDGTIPSLQSLLQGLKDQPETADISVVVAQPADAPTAALPELGAHTIATSSLTPIALWRAVNRTRREDYALPPAREPLGDLDVRELCDRAVRELKRGLLDAADTESQSMVVSLGEGTEIKAAIWTAVARIREILGAQSDGRIRFGSGPEGAVVLASSARTGRRRGALQDCSSLNLTGRRIVVADDDPAITWVVGGTLRAAGADVREVHDGRRALTLVHNWWPELIVSDVLMPGMDGFALCREVKRDVALRDVPVILLSWKEDLLFRLRELGADADAYLRKEANSSSLVEHAKELLWPRISLERRLLTGQEVRGRLDGITPRSLMDLGCKTERNLRIMLRDATSHYDVRIRDRSLRAVSRTRSAGGVERGQAALASFLGVSAGRFSVVTDDQSCDSDFAEQTLDAVLRTPILRSRAAQRVLSGATLALVERLTLDPDAFVEELSLLPLSLRPIVDELLRGTAPRQLLASGATSLRALESLLSDAARRGAIRSLAGPAGEDLLTQEILALSAPSSEPPSVESKEMPALFTFQLSPTPPPTAAVAEPEPEVLAVLEPVALATQLSEPATSTLVEPAKSMPQAVTINEADDAFDWAAEASWDLAPPDPDPAVKAERASPFSRPKFSAEWGTEKKTSPGVGTVGATLKETSGGASDRADAAPADAVVRAAPPLGEPERPSPSPNETPQLAQMVMQNAEPRGQVQAGLTRPIQHTETLEKEPVTSETKATNPNVELSDKVSPTTVAIPEVHPVIVSPQAVVEYKRPQSPEDEAIFPLLSSPAPEKRSSPQVAPVAVTVIETPCTTLPSELAPRVEAPRSPDEVQLRPETDDRPSSEHSSSGSQCADSIQPEAASDATTRNSVPNLLEPPVEPVHAGSAGSQNSSRLGGLLLGLALMVSAGGLAFVIALPIIRSLSSSEPPATTPSTVSTSEEAPALAPSISVSVVAVEDSSIPHEANDLPSSTIAPDKGLVVVKTGGVHSIFVDDEFVGRGPERVVTLNPGAHKVRASLNGEDHTESVVAIAGRAVELSLERPGNQ